ncbi:MAG: hypothetical protein NVS1B6_09970 [Steroidobacteraceae bacterium]
MHAWAAICLAGTLVACGQKGPLLLPDSPKHKKVAPRPRPPAAPAETAPGAPSAPPAMSAPAVDIPRNPPDAQQKP